MRVWVNVKRTRTIPGGLLFCACPGTAAISAAAQTLAHESIHLRGVSDEAAAECYGRQLAKTVFLRLGAPSADYVYELGRYALAIHTDPAYSSAECRDGGALDLDPASPIWP